MKSLQDFDALLRTMDAADDGTTTPGRAEADLDRILASTPGPTGAARSCSAAPRPRWPRAVVIGGLAAAATAGLLFVPALDGGDPAFATWTAAPAALNEADRQDAVEDCRASRSGFVDGIYEKDVAAADVAIAERRGAWVTVVLAGADGFEATCVTDASAPWFGGGMIGSMGKFGADSGPGPRSLAATQLGTGLIDSNPISMASGRAGSEIASLTYTSIGGEEVVATVAKGQFAFWLPGDELQNAADTGAAVEVTYRDGTTETQTLRF